MTEGPLPGNIETGVVIGKFITAQRGVGNVPVEVPIAGTVRFTPTPLSLTDVSAVPPVVILPLPVTVTLDNTGSFSVTLVATNDPDLSPVGWNYAVGFAFNTGTLKGFNINVPRGTTVDLATVVPVGASSGIQIVRGFGVPDPASASEGQVVTYQSGTTVWANPTGGGGGGGSGIPNDASVTNVKVATNAAINADKLVDGTNNKLLTAAERTKLSGTEVTSAKNANNGYAGLDAVAHLSLAREVAGGVFSVIYDGVNWRYAGAVVSARPTPRTDLVMLCINPVNSNVPPFAITGDLLAPNVPF